MLHLPTNRSWHFRLVQNLILHESRLEAKKLPKHQVGHADTRGRIPDMPSPFGNTHPGVFVRLILPPQLVSLGPISLQRYRSESPVKIDSFLRLIQVL